MRKTTKIVAAIAIILVLAIPVAVWYRARSLRREIEEAMPRIGIIDFYGLHNVTEHQIRAHLRIKEGDTAPGDLDPGFMNVLAKLTWRLSGQSELESSAVVASVQQVPGVVRADVTSVQGSGNGKATVFVGIEESSGPRFAYRPAPNGTVALPANIVDAYNQLVEALPGALANNVQEDDTQGYALHSDPAMRASEEKMIAYDASDLARVREVLKNSADPAQRTAAAWTIGYAPDKRLILDDLLDAARDSDETVRNNATRAIGVISEYAANKPELGIRIDPAPFVDMLNSLVWTDRNKATMVLYGLTETRPAGTLQLLRERALPSLLEMAKWKDDHAWDALELLGRIGGMDDKDIQSARAQNDRERVISAATAAARSSAPAPHTP